MEANKIEVSKALSLGLLHFGKAFKSGRNTYTYIDTAKDIEVEEWINEEGQQRQATWNFYILIAKDANGNYKIFKQTDFIQI